MANSYLDYYKQRAQGADKARRERSEKYSYDDKGWSDWSDDYLFDSDEYSKSKYSASSHLRNYWGGYSSRKKRSSTADKLETALAAVARSTNAIRTSVTGVDKTLKVAWSDGNATNDDDLVVLSPDTITRGDARAEWNEDKRSDALVGEALTAAAKKRTTAKAVRQAAAASTDKHARVVWSAVEADIAQSELLTDYRGAAVYFAASNAFNSDESYRAEIEAGLVKAAPSPSNGVVVPDDMPQGPPPSQCAAAAMAWNILHPSKPIVAPQDIAEVIGQAMAEFGSATTSHERWAAAQRAAEILRKLDPPKPPPKKQPQPNPQGGSGSGSGDGAPQPPPPARPKPSKDLLDKARGRIGTSDISGESITNDTALGDIDGRAHDVSDLADQDDSSKAGGKLATRAKKTHFSDWSSRTPVHAQMAVQALLRGYEGVIDRLSQLCRIYSHDEITPSFGRQSGHLDPGKLWEIPCGETSVFYRNDVVTESREIAIGILTDLSGSTGCDLDRGTWADPDVNITVAERVERLKALQHQTASVPLKRAACLLSEALRRGGNAVRVHSYGHSNDVHYYGSTPQVTIDCMGGGTKEDIALAAAAKHMDSIDKAPRKIMICIGDGETDIQKLKEIVDLCRRMSIEVYGIVIGGRNGERSFGKGRFVSVSWDDADKIVPMLVSFVTRVLSK